MVTSMTGFGQAERSIAGFRMQIDLKSVNHRYCEVAVRLPREFARYENTVKQAIQQRVKRGRVDAFVTVERDREAPLEVDIDWALAQSYRHAAEALREKLSLTGELTLREVLGLPGIVSFRDKPDLDEESLEYEIAACANAAVSELVSMREREGNFFCWGIFTVAWKPSNGSGSTPPGLHLRSFKNMPSSLGAAFRICCSRRSWTKRVWLWKWHCSRIARASMKN